MAMSRDAPSRIAQNIDLFGFDLTAADLTAIDSLEGDGRTGPDPATVNAA